ncbi:MAG: glycosyltransferase family 4 protein, partial [Acidobacteriales bacterium]|nr:glycosyltransferase family 4 protein [Terriglobales bacterium]
GHDVTVLTGFPNHPTGRVPPEYRRKFRRLVARENDGKVSVVRTWLLPFPNRKAYERMLNYSSFCLSAALTGLFLSRPDVVIASSPQLLVGLSGWYIAFSKLVPLIFEVRDLWPESLAAVGMGKRDSGLYRLLWKVASFLYRRSDHIVVVTPAFRDYLMEHWQVPCEKISVVENGVETDLFRPQEPDPILRSELDLEGNFVVAYVGTIGMAHGLETLLDAAALLQTKAAPVLFFIVGEGADRERIQKLAVRLKLLNVRFVGQQPREKIPRYMCAADACLVLLKKSEVFRTVIPTKMLEFMACGRPVILGVEGQASDILQAANGGISIAPENSTELADAILRLAGDSQLSQTMGANGRNYILNFFSRGKTAASYLEVLQRVIGKTA